MPKKRTQLAIALAALFVAALATVVAWTGIRSRIKPVLLVEATTQVPPMTRISAGDLKAVSVPKGRLTGSQYIAGSLAGDMVGHYTVYGLYPGEVVVPADIAAATPQTSTYDARLMELRQQAKAQVATALAGLTKLHIQPPAGNSTTFTAPAVPASSTASGTGASGSSTGGSATTGTTASTKKAAAKQAEIDAAEAAYTTAVQNLATVSQDVAVTLQISEQQGFALVHTGDHVTVFGTVHDSSQNTVAFAVADRVLVLGRQGSSTGAAVNGAVSGLLVLALTPPEVERLMLSQQAGSLLVVLNPIGGGQLTIGTVTSADLLGTSATTQASATTTVASAGAPGAVVPQTGA